MAFLPTLRRAFAETGLQALGPILAVPLSLAGTAFLTYLMLVGSRLGA